MRLPAARIPMSFIVTPPSASAFLAASAARSMASLSACLPNLVIEIPRIHTSSDTGCLQGFEAEAHCFCAFTVGCHRERRQPDLHAEVYVLGVGVDVDDVAADAGAVAVDDGGDKRHGHPRRR